MQGKQSNLENFPSQERKQSKNHCSPVKLEKKDKKIMASRDWSGGAIQTTVQEKPRPPSKGDKIKPVNYLEKYTLNRKIRKNLFSVF